MIRSCLAIYLKHYVNLKLRLVIYAVEHKLTVLLQVVYIRNEVLLKNWHFH